MKGMILAAGEGRRLRPLTESVPKPMLRVGSGPILEHNVRLLARNGIDDIVINLHHCPEAVTSHFGNGAPWGVRIVYSHEPRLLGTAGAIRKVAERFDSTFVVLYGDNLFSLDLGSVLEFHRRARSDATVVVYRREDVSASGIVELDAEDRVIRFLEKPGKEEVFSHWVNAGLLVLEPSVIEEIPKGEPSDFGRDVLPRLVERRKPVYGYRMSSRDGLWWIDTPQDLERLRREIPQEALR